MTEPGPLIVAPHEVANAQFSPRDAVDCSPEEDKIALPALRDEMRILEQEVEQVGVEGGLATQFFAEIMAPKQCAAPLLVRAVQFNLTVEASQTNWRSPLLCSSISQSPTTIRRPGTRNERLNPQIDDVLNDGVHQNSSCPA